MLRVYNFIMGTGFDLTMDHKIPTTLWKTQLLKLVSEAPKAVCIVCDVEWDSQQLLLQSQHSGLISITPTSYVSSSSTNSSADINLIHQPHPQHQQQQQHSNSKLHHLLHTNSNSNENGAITNNNSNDCHHSTYHHFHNNSSNSQCHHNSEHFLSTSTTNGINGHLTTSITASVGTCTSTLIVDDPILLGNDDNGHVDEIVVDDDDKLGNNGFSTETLKTTSSSSMSSNGIGDGHCLIDSSNNGSTNNIISHNNLITVSNGSSTTPPSIWDPMLMEFSNPFGKAFHGYLTHSQMSELLTKDGHYLVRRKKGCDDDEFILSLRFNGHIKNFQISYEDSTGYLFVGERDKPYRSLQELVQEGLITLYLDQKEGPYIDLMCDLSKFHLGLNNNNASSKTYGSNNSISNGINSNKSNNEHSNNHHHNYLTGNKSLLGSRSFRNGSSSPSPTISSKLSSSSERQTKSQELRKHSFHIHTFAGLTTCQLCQNFLWGLSSQGLQCSDCEFSIHETCLKDAQNNCKPKPELIKSIFGTSLNIIMKSGDGISPPFVLEKCIAQIEKKGLFMEGIYRVSGSKELIERLKTRVELERETMDLTNYNDIHSMCGLVKLYLRNLPESLITTEVFEKFLQVNSSISLDMIKRNIRKLPQSHQITLKFLLQHLHKVAEKSEFNKMNAFNIASVFAPTIICSYEISLSTLKVGTNILETMITFVPILYPDKS